MKTMILVFHPNLNESKVNQTLAQAAGEVDHVMVRDMYQEYQDQPLDVKKEQQLMEEADRVILQFPMYWYSSPSLLKQWEDEVLEHGWAYGSTGKALHGKELMVAVSTGAEFEKYDRESGEYGVRDLLRPFQATSALIGMDYLTPFVTYGALRMSDDKLAEVAKEYQQIVRSDVNQLGHDE